MPATDTPLKYSVSDLGLMDHVGSSARTINEQGDVIGTLGSGGSDDFSPQSNHTFLWSDNKVTDFGRSRAVFGINNKGQMVGIKYLPTFDSFDSAEMLAVSPILYSSGKWKSILPKSSAFGSASAINDSGQVAGQLRLASSKTNHLLPAVWRSSEVQLLEIPDPCISGVVRCINNEGQAAGFLQRVSSKPTAYKTYAVLWDTQGVTLLGSLPDSGQNEAVAINNNGCILGVATFGSEEFAKYMRELMKGKKPLKEQTLSFGGFLWNKGALTALVTPDDPVIEIDRSKSYVPRAINDSDVVVGRAAGLDGKQVAFVWQDRKMTDLNTLISADTGWALTEARGVNNRGQIVGDGKYNGQTHAFLLTPL